MIKGLATIFVGMFMLLSSAPLAWSIGEQAVEGQTSEGTFRAQVESLELGLLSSIGLSILERYHTDDQMLLMQHLLETYRRAIRGASRSTGSDSTQKLNPLYYFANGNLSNVTNDQNQVRLETKT
jgi:hypothetical protein